MCVMLLPRHNLAHFGFGILDQFAVDVHRYAVNRAGELERRGVLGCDWRTAIAAALQRPTRDARIVLAFLRGFELEQLSRPERKSWQRRLKTDLAHLVTALVEGDA